MYLVKGHWNVDKTYHIVAAVLFRDDPFVGENVEGLDVKRQVSVRS